MHAGWLKKESATQAGSFAKRWVVLDAECGLFCYKDSGLKFAPDGSGIVGGDCKNSFEIDGGAVRVGVLGPCIRVEACRERGTPTTVNVVFKADSDDDARTWATKIASMTSQAAQGQGVQDLAAASPQSTTSARRRRSSAMRRSTPKKTPNVRVTLQEPVPEEPEGDEERLAGPVVFYATRKTLFGAKTEGLDAAAAKKQDLAGRRGSLMAGDAAQDMLASKEGPKQGENRRSNRRRKAKQPTSNLEACLTSMGAEAPKPEGEGAAASARAGTGSLAPGARAPWAAPPSKPGAAPAQVPRNGQEKPSWVVQQQQKLADAPANGNGKPAWAKGQDEPKARPPWANQQPVTPEKVVLKPTGLLNVATPGSKYSSSPASSGGVMGRVSSRVSSLRRRRSGNKPAAAAVSTPIVPVVVKANPQAGKSVETFAQCSSVADILSSFDDVLEQTQVSADLEYELLPALVAALGVSLPHRTKQFFGALVERRAKPQYDCVPECRQLTAVVLGGGPIGLRAAIELALCGCSVHLIESRDKFVRLNVLHLWEWVEADLIELGIKALDPSVFAAADFKHVATCQMQHSLLKVALLLGVHLHFECPVTSLAALEEAGFFAAANAPAAGGRQLRAAYHLMVDATGARCPIFDSLGFEQVTVLKSAQALGLVCHMKNGKTKMETQLKESNWSHQFHQAKFTSLADAGVTLQNIVYYRSTGAYSEWATHYFVMTAQADSMLSFGALKQAAVAHDPNSLCARSNIDYEKMESYCRRAVGAFVPQLETHELVPNQLQLFDFSERKQSNRATALVPSKKLAASAQGGAAAAAGGDGGAAHSQVLVTRVGDALQEPFWPEGLGINRGFLHCLDCADLAKGYARALAKGGGDLGAALEQLCARREGLFQVTKQVSGYNRATELKPYADKQHKLAYQHDPRSRYVNLPADLPQMPV